MSHFPCLDFFFPAFPPRPLPPLAAALPDESELPEELLLLPLRLEPGLPDPEEEDDLSFFLPPRFFFFFRGSSAGDADLSRLPRLLRLRASFLPVLAGLPAPSSTSIEVSTRLVAAWRSRTLSVLPVVLGGGGLAGLAGPATKTRVKLH